MTKLEWDSIVLNRKKRDKGYKRNTCNWNSDIDVIVKMEKDGPGKDEICTAECRNRAIMDSESKEEGQTCSSLEIDAEAKQQMQHTN